MYWTLEFATNGIVSHEKIKYKLLFNSSEKLYKKNKRKQEKLQILFWNLIIEKKSVKKK